MVLSVHFYHRINHNLQTSSGKQPFNSIKNPEDKIRWTSRKVGHAGLETKRDLHAMLVASVHTAELLTVTLCTKQSSGALNQALMIRTTESEQFTALLAIYAHAKWSVHLSFLSLSFPVQSACISGNRNRIYWCNWPMLLKLRYCFVPFKSLFFLFCKQLYDTDKKKKAHTIKLYQDKKAVTKNARANI